jgi:hypothetical protein
MKINLWYNNQMGRWRWTLCNAHDITEQHSGEQPDLRVAMNDIANTVEYILEQQEK